MNSTGVMTMPMSSVAMAMKGSGMKKIDGYGRTVPSAVGLRLHQKPRPHQMSEARMRPIPKERKIKALMKPMRKPARPMRMPETL